MSYRLRHLELRRLLGVAAELAAITDPAALPHTLYRETRGLLPTDRFTYNEGLLPRGGTLEVRVSVQEPFVLPQTHVAGFNALMHQHPCLDYMRRDSSAVRISDFTTMRQFRRCGLYQTCFKPLGIEHQLLIAFPVGGARIVTVGFNRRGRDFSGEERTALDLLRVHIQHAHHRVQRFRPVAWDDAALRSLRQLGLSPREAEVLSWLAQGKTNAEIGLILGMGVATVKTHLLHVFAKLGCEARTAAARVALEAVALDRGS